MRSYTFVHLCCVWIAATFAISCGAVRTRSRAHYGDFCDNRSIRCESSLSLACKDNKCECMKPDNMVYDPIRGSCTALAGEKCKFTVIEEYRSWQEEILCVAHAHCHFTENICVCDKDYMELSNGTCISKKNYSEPCETSSDCKQDASLICYNSKCTCNPNISEYSESLKSCVGLADKPCVNDLCVTNAICREDPRRAYYGSSPEFDSSEEEYSEVLRDPASIGRCQCRTAFGVTPGGHCALGFGGKCDHQEAKCMDYLKCVEGQCVCRYPSHMMYDKTAETCLSKVFGPCTENGSNKTKIGCVSGAICSKREGSSQRFQCLCPAGFIENGERGCNLDFGQKCITQPSTSSRHSSSSSSPSTTKCDKIAKLSCVDGRCMCIDDLHVYDKTSRRCTALVGGLCNVKNKDDCVSGSFCKPRRGVEYEGFCQCQEHYAENDDGTCSPKPQQSSIALKSGGSGSEGILDKWNVSSNTVWAIFDKSEE